MTCAGSVSVVSDQTSATIQPMTVHPRNKFRAKIAARLRLFQPRIVGRKYSAKTRMKRTIPPTASPPLCTEAAPAAKERRQCITGRQRFRYLKRVFVPVNVLLLLSDERRSSLPVLVCSRCGNFCSIGGPLQHSQPPQGQHGVKQGLAAALSEYVESGVGNSKPENLWRECLISAAKSGNPICAIGVLKNSPRFLARRDFLLTSKYFRARVTPLGIWEC